MFCVFVCKDEPEDVAATTLPGVHGASSLAYYVCLPGALLFLVYIYAAGS